MYEKNFFKFFFGIVLILVILGQVVISFAQFDFDVPYEVSAEVLVVENNFVKARKKSCKNSFEVSLGEGLAGNVGE